MADPAIPALTPADHHDEALRLLAKVNEYPAASPVRLALTIQANVHATLSLAHEPAVIETITLEPSPEVEAKPTPKPRARKPRTVKPAEVTA